MRISVVIPAYNEEGMIKTCLDHVADSSAATGGIDTEIIVVNNASTDRTADIAASFSGVRVIDEPRKGLVWARRAGLQASSGDIIANVDADTRMPEGWLGAVASAFKEDQTLLALSGPQVYYDVSWGLRLLTSVWYAVGFIFDTASRMFGGGSMLQGGNYAVKKDALERIGGYNTDIEFWGEDTDVGKRLGKIGKIKWTFALSMPASGRRLRKKGIMKTGYMHARTFISISMFGKLFNKKYDDIRE